MARRLVLGVVELMVATGIPFVEAVNHFEANANRDGLVECSGQLRAIGIALFTVANNIRWLGSGPRCGFYEIMLPDRQPGSSIMPGKVNPVMCESLMQVVARIIGNDQIDWSASATMPSSRRSYRSSIRRMVSASNKSVV